MAQNALMFEDYLKLQDISLEKQVNEDGVVYVVRENIGAVGPVAAVVLFNNNDRIVTVICYQYLKITKPENKPEIRSLLNAINTEYTMVKFTEAADAVTVQIALPFNGNFVPELIVEMIALVLQAIEEEHPKFMELI